MSRQREEAFTLVELLVVVAIIAILAAIAIPNFLEAQTRAKVSRAKADMKAMTTAVESYHVDHNSYPPINIDINTREHAPYIEARHVYLTTPIAYLSTIQTDPFGDRVRLSYITSSDLEPKYRTYDFLTFNDSEALETLIYLSDLIVLKGYPETTQWFMASQGPDKTVGLHYDVGLVYDPTNGTVSDGDIIATGPGAPLRGGGNP